MSDAIGIEGLLGHVWSEEMCASGPIPLGSWLVTSQNEAVAYSVGHLYGESVRPVTRPAGGFEVMLQSDVVEVRVDYPVDVVSRFIRGTENDPDHLCDGAILLAPAHAAGRPCGCPTLPHERRAAAASGAGPKPDVRLDCRLLRAPELGRFRYSSSSWSFSESLNSLTTQIRRADGPTRLELRLDGRRLTTRSGVEVSLRWPMVAAGAAAEGDAFQR